MPRRIVAWIGSDSDLPQARDGIRFLVDADSRGEIELVSVVTASIHRHTLRSLARMREYSVNRTCDVVVAGAGRANHLTGVLDSFLRYDLQDPTIVVVGVGFEDPSNPDFVETAYRSIRDVPGTQVVMEDDDGPFLGSNGFLRACIHATHGELPVVTTKQAPPGRERSGGEALAVADRMIAEAAAKKALGQPA